MFLMCSIFFSTRQIDELDFLFQRFSCVNCGWWTDFSSWLTVPAAEGNEDVFFYRSCLCWMELECDYLTACACNSEFVWFCAM